MSFPEFTSAVKPNKNNTHTHTHTTDSVKAENLHNVDLLMYIK